MTTDDTPTGPTDIPTPTRTPHHGTYSEYTNHKCRCVLCRAANTRYNLKRREERARRLVNNRVTVQHGEYSTYTNWGCRCDLCKAANSERARLKEHEG